MAEPARIARPAHAAEVAALMELGTATRDRDARRLYEGLGFTNLEKPGDPETSMLYYEREL